MHNEKVRNIFISPFICKINLKSTEVSEMWYLPAVTGYELLNRSKDKDVHIDSLAHSRTPPPHSRARGTNLAATPKPRNSKSPDNKLTTIFRIFH